MSSLLLVDDEKDAIEAMQMYLEMNGYTVRLALSGQEGVEAVKAAVPDLVLLDLQMTGIDGWETLKQMRGIAPNIQVVILTGSVPDRELEEKAASGGALGFITKPIQLDDLVPQIRGFLGKG